MAVCALCGAKTKVFPKKREIGSEEIPLCDECYDLSKGTDYLELAEAVISAGLYYSCEQIAEWAENERTKRSEKEAARIEYIKAHYFGVCPKCGGMMLEEGRRDILTDESILPLENLSKWNTDTSSFMTVSCDSCGYAEFYKFNKYKKPEAALPSENSGDTETQIE